jgi:hypothetical protein
MGGCPLAFFGGTVSTLRLRYRVTSCFLRKVETNVERT